MEIPAAGSAMRRLNDRVAAVRGWRRLALAAGLGVLAAGALPPLHLLVLLIPAFTGLVWLIGASPSRRSAFATGWWFGLGYFAAGIYWIAFALLTFPEKFGWMVPFAVLGLSALLALFPAVTALLSRPALGRGAGGILVFAAGWTALEWVRGWAFTGFPWNLIGTSWTISDSMIQFASLAGVYGLSLLGVSAAAMPATLGEGGGNGKSGLAALSPILTAFAVLAVVWSAGWLRLAGADDAVVAKVNLRLVQPNIDQRLKWVPDLRFGHVADQLEMSARTAGASPTHVIWAETAVPFYLANSPKLLEFIAKSAPPGGLMIVGSLRTTPRRQDPHLVWNSLHAVDSAARVVATYDKFHLVPFGEYMPFRNILKITKLTAGATGFSPGPGVKTLRLPGLPPVSPLICYEVIFPGKVADRSDRPGWLLNITNDGWYGRSSGPYQHFAAARLRAVEEGLPLVRVANTGISAVVDAYGRTRAYLGLGRAGILDSPLPVRLEEATPYARLGDWIVLTLLAATAGAGFLMSRGKTPGGAGGDEY